MNQAQKYCPNCGPVLARTGDPPTCAEHIGGGLLSAVTCGVGALLYLPYVVWKGYQSGIYRCPNCGSKC